MKKAFWLNPRDKPALLIAIMRELAGDAHISFEGDLSGCDFSGIPGVDYRMETGVIRSSGTVSGTFIIIPLEPDTISQILEQVLPHGRIVRQFEQIQIRKFGEIQFLSGDYFHRECVSVGPAVPESLLEKLIQRGILRGYHRAKTC